MLTTVLPPTHFDWAEDAELLPIASRSPLLPRDFSVLRSNTPQPFNSIQRQTCHRNQMRNPPIRLFTRRSQPVWSMGPVVTHHYPFGSGLGSPKVVIPSPRPHKPSPKLDWDGDPRLADLSRVLRSLGWAPTCWVSFCYILFIVQNFWHCMDTLFLIPIVLFFHCLFVFSFSRRRGRRHFGDG